VLNSDESKERLRLASTYAAMTDGELLKLASKPDSLTDAAWEALEDELDRRHLEPAAPAELPPEMDYRKLLVIRQFRDLPEALLAKGSLESAGIQCFLRDENLVRLDWFISNFVGGVKLCVNPEDAENATRLLDEPILEGMYVHGVGLYEQPRCPKCQSLDVNFQELDRPVAYLSAFLRVPMPIQRKGWRCHSCNAEWEDEGMQV
jgi:Putative prokaryotic signal transducing protein